MDFREDYAICGVKYYVEGGITYATVILHKAIQFGLTDWDTTTTRILVNADQHPDIKRCDSGMSYMIQKGYYERILSWGIGEPRITYGEDFLDIVANQ